MPPSMMWTYPWDLYDTGIDPTLEAIASKAKLEAVSLAVSYHISTYFLPQNPRRSIFFGEDGRVYFQPELARYAATAIAPPVSDHVTGPDYLPRLVKTIRGHGLGFIAWVVYNYSHFLGRTYPQCAKEDALGNRYLSQLCPANPDVRAYHLALTADICANYRPDYLFIESPGYLAHSYGWSNPKVQTPISPRGGFLLDLCFCAACRAAGNAAGVDADCLRDEVAAYLRVDLLELPDAQPPLPDADFQRTAFDGALGQYLAVRAGVEVDGYAAIVRECHAHGVKVFGSATMQASGHQAHIAGTLDRGLGSMPMNDSLAETVRRQKASLRPGADLIAHGHPGQYSDQDAFVSHVLACRDAGADGFGCYNYGLVRPAHLQWVGAAVDAWGNGR